MEVDKNLEYRKQEAVAISKVERVRIKETRDSFRDTDQMKRNSLLPLPSKKLAVKKLYRQSESFHSALHLALHYECALCLLLSSAWLFKTPWTAAYQAPLPMEFPRQEYWSRLPFPPPRDLLNPGIKPTSLLSPESAGKFFTTVPPGKPLTMNG